MTPEQSKPNFKEIDEWFSCDCGSDCHGLLATIMDDRMLILEMVDNSFLNIPIHWRLWRALKIFWSAFWDHEHSIEVVLSRHEHRMFKAFANTLEDWRCLKCNPDYLEGKGKWWEHGH
jgi:hypothetical protein